MVRAASCDQAAWSPPLAGSAESRRGAPPFSRTCGGCVGVAAGLRPTRTCGGGAGVAAG